jgi:hypothetical protein
MSEVEIPNFGEVLASHLSGVPQDALPYLLSQLERNAAARYRKWASQLSSHKEGLLECADCEEEIAKRAEAMFPLSPEDRASVDEILPDAKAAYNKVFEGYEPIDQMTIQANAERQGASAWQGLKAVHPAKAVQLDEISEIELKSADYLDQLLSELK